MGGAHILSTVITSSLESFTLFYEELKPTKSAVNRLRRISVATS